MPLSQPEPTEEGDLQGSLSALSCGAERRRAQRDALTLPVELRFADQAMVGSSADVSDTGLLFLTDAPVEVVVRIETEAGPVEHRGWCAVSSWAPRSRPWRSPSSRPASAAGLDARAPRGPGSAHGRAAR
jgi:hypothetical protein